MPCISTSSTRRFHSTLFFHYCRRRSLARSFVRRTSLKEEYGKQQNGRLPTTTHTTHTHNRTVKMEKIPIWLDCDPGHDDAMAILLTSFLPYFDLLGVSTVHGNAPLENTTTNAISILTAYKKTEVKVYPGAEKPLVRPLNVAESIHGKSGLDGTALLPSPGFPPQPDHSAVNAMAKAIEEHPGQIAIAATGTLTNIAVLVERHPELLDKIAYLTVMGGGFGIGNYSKYAEFNIWCDAKAAQIVLNNPILAPKTIIASLNITHQAIATEEVLTKIQKGNNPDNKKRSLVREMLYELLTFFADTYKNVFGFNNGPPVHDPLAVACLLPFYKTRLPHCDIPDLELKYTQHELDITQSGEREGETVQVKESKDGVIIAEMVNMNKFWGLVFEAVDNLDEHVSKS